MDIQLPKLIFTSVVRGSQQGESHGGVVYGRFRSTRGLAARRLEYERHRLRRTQCEPGPARHRVPRGRHLHRRERRTVPVRPRLQGASYRNRYLRHCHEPAAGIGRYCSPPPASTACSPSTSNGASTCGDSIGRLDAISSLLPDPALFLYTPLVRLRPLSRHPERGHRTAAGGVTQPSSARISRTSCIVRRSNETSMSVSTVARAS